jgi:hypothetical protein
LQTQRATRPQVLGRCSNWSGPTRTKNTARPKILLRLNSSRFCRLTAAISAHSGAKATRLFDVKSSSAFVDIFETTWRERIIALSEPPRPRFRWKRTYTGQRNPPKRSSATANGYFLCKRWVRSSSARNPSLFSFINSRNCLDSSTIAAVS